MTRLPTARRDVRGVDGPPYDLNAVCAVPLCFESNLERHHIWRRSELVGAHNWVIFPDGDLAVGNEVGLCHWHHEAVTKNAAWIRFDEDNEVFTWESILTPQVALQWQPPVVKRSEVAEYQTEHEIKDTFDQPEAVITNVTNGKSNPHICPSCKRPLPAPKIDNGSEPKRPRRTWSVTVPMDERENGAATLDALLEASRDEMAKAGLPYGETEAVKFFVLTAALGLFVQHAHMLVSE